MWEIITGTDNTYSSIIFDPTITGLRDGVRFSFFTSTGGADGILFAEITAVAVPEPAAWGASLGLGLLALALIRRRHARPSRETTAGR